MRTPLLLLLALSPLAGCMVSGTAPATCDPPGTQISAPTAAGCVAVDQGKLLMVRDATGWTIPAGRMEAGESSADAAARETREEAGVEVMAGPPVCAVVKNDFVAHACVTQGTLPTPTAGSEVSAARWVSAQELQAMSPTELRYPAQRPTWLAIMQGAAAAQERLESGGSAPPAVE